MTLTPPAAESADTVAAPVGAAEELFAGPGEMRALCRALDWSATPLGPVETWSQSLRTTAGIVLGSRNPMFLFWGPELVQLYNDAYRPSLGGADEAGGGRHPRALGARGREFWTDIWDAIGPQIERVMTWGEATWHEDQYLPIERNGRLEDVWWTYSYSPVRDDDGRVNATLVVCQETTRRVLSERERERLLGELDLERSRLAELFRQAPSFLAVLRGPDHVFELVNDAYYGLIGHRDVLGKPAAEALPEIREQRFLSLLDGVLHTGEPFVGREVPVLLARTPGAPPEERFVDFVYQPLVEADGTRSGVVAHGSDVTEQVLARREVERLLAEAEQARRETAGILSATSDGILGVDPQGRTTFANAAAERLLGWTADEMIGRPQHDLIHHTRPDGTPYPPTECPLYQARLAGEVRHVEGEVFWRKDGTSVPVEYEMTPLTDQGVLVGAVVTFRDITERQRAMAERERLLLAERRARAEAEREHREAETARAEAEAANRAKSEFLAVMSHELRTPLNAIGGYAELLEMEIRGPMTPRQREDLRRIQQSQRHLLGLINEVLNYAKLETGTVHFDITDVPVHAALAAAESLVAPQARARGLSLAVADPPTGLAARADPEKLRQVLVNLLSNAVKFTERGGRIEVSCAVEDGVVRVRVRDTGIGIPADRLDAIFDPFVQVRADLTRPHEGTGLGLAISRDLARGMGGELVAESTLGQGSTFTLSVPAA